MGLQKLVRDSQLAAEEMGSEWPLAETGAALGPHTSTTEGEDRMLVTTREND